MENPFQDFTTFRNPYYESYRPHYYYHPSAPVFTSNPRPIPARRPAGPSPPPQQPKVVSIPVHFVATERSRSAIAVKIQKVFRGFLVRKAVGKILEVRSEVEEVERRVTGAETAERVQRDDKERLKLSEMLMSLLFRLDSIRAFDLGVRECRRRVIRRVIELQEKVDALVAEKREERGAGVSTGSSIDQSSVDENRDIMVEEGALLVADSAADRKLGLDNVASMEHPDSSVDQPSVDENPTMEAEDHALTECEESETTASRSDRDQTLATVASAAIPDLAAIDRTPAAAGKSSGAGDPEIAPNLDLQHECLAPPEMETELLTDCPKSTTENCHSSVEKGKEEGSERQGCANYLDVLERTVEANVKLQQLVSELCEKHVVQGRVMKTLSQRVEQLERVVARKSKKKRRASVFSCEQRKDCMKKA